MNELFGPAFGIISLLIAVVFAYLVLKKPMGNEKMVEIAAAIKAGADAFIKRQYMTIAAFVIVLSALIAWIPQLGVNIAMAFVLGAIASSVAGIIGMSIAVRSNARTTAAAKEGLKASFGVAFNGGAVMGFTVAGLATLGIGALLYMFSGKPADVIGFSFGASLVALFIRVGGGIFTKAADVGADLVGKVEKNIPEDDPRNPAVIADNVGDNVGDCAGMGADLFESYAGAIISTMIIGAVAVLNGAALGTNGVVFPMLVAGAGILASVIGVFAARLTPNPQNALRMSMYVSYVVVAALIYWLAAMLFPGATGFGIFIAAIAGIASGIVISFTAEYYTSKDFAPVKEIAKAAQTGTGTLLITGFGEAFMSTLPQVVVVCASILVAFNYAGMYGIAVAGLGMLSIIAAITALDTFGPISDNAGGIAEMSNLDPKYRKITDELDSVGNTVKALTKGFAMGASALISLALLSAFYEVSGLAATGGADLAKPIVLVGVLLGAMIPFVFSAFCMKAVGRTAFAIVEEVRRQWRDIKGISTGAAKPDYARCVDICTTSSIKELAVPALIIVCAPVVVGFWLGAAALAGFLVGATASAFVLAALMVNAGGAWDNAKKYIEDGNFGGKGSPAHASAVVGDTLGDPFKDTAGPALNVVIKLMSVVSLVIAPLLIKAVA